MRKENFESNLGESYVKAVHPSGLEVYVMEKPQYSSAYAIFGTKYGSIDTSFEDDLGEMINVPEGIAHYLEHKLFESEDGDAFTRFAKTGASANAFTSFDRTCYLFSCSDNFYENFDILLDFVRHPYFTEENVRKEQGIIGQEIRMYDDSPAWRVMFNMLFNMYHVHPVRIDIAGTVESIAEINSDLLYKCYNTFYHPSNMFICIVGNVDADKIIKKVKEANFAEDKKEIVRGTFTEPQDVVSNYVEQHLEVNIPMFCLGFKQKIETPFRRLKSKICVSLLLEIICGDSSPLYADLIKRGLINDEFSAEYFNGNGYAAIIFDGESKDPKAVEQAIKDEIKRLRENGIDKKLFSAVKCGMYGDAIRRFNSVDGMTMQLVEGAVFGYDIFEEIKLLKAASYDDVTKRLDVFCEENSVLSVILPKQSEVE